MTIKNEMQDFMFHAPTQLFFGRSALDNLAESINLWSPKKRVLLVYGGGSIKRSGLYDKVMGILNEDGVFVKELPGVEPNPKMALVREGVHICRENRIEAVLAVGGGSCVDTAKAVATAFYYDGDVSELVGQWWLKEVLPVLVISTASGAGTEMTTSTVLNNEATKVKKGFHGPELRPKVTFLDPEYTFTVNPYQTAAGIVDGISHTLESYFTLIDGAYMHARFGEALLKTFFEYGPVAYEEPDNYNARANVMLACTWACNGVLTKGNYVAWICHGLEHELSAYNDKITHGAGLAVITPRWMRWALDENTAFRFVDIGVNVFGMDKDMPPMEMGLKVIEKFEDLFFNVLHMPKSFAELGVPEDAMDFMVDRLKHVVSPGIQKMLFKPMEVEDIKTVLANCFE